VCTVEICEAAQPADNARRRQGLHSVSRFRPISFEYERFCLAVHAWQALLPVCRPEYRQRIVAPAPNRRGLDFPDISKSKTAFVRARPDDIVERARKFTSSAVVGPRASGFGYAPVPIPPGWNVFVSAQRDCRFLQFNRNQIPHRKGLQNLDGAISGTRCIYATRRGPFRGSRYAQVPHRLRQKIASLRVADVLLDSVPFW